MARIAVLGGGMVGSAIAVDLAQDADVTVVDAREEALQRLEARVRTRRADLAQPAAVREAIEDADIVVGALSSHLGLATMQTVVEQGRAYVDISFMAEDPLQLDGLAKSTGAVVVFDCGVGPGTTNMLVGHATTLLDSCEAIDVCVGGLPAVRTWPFEYKAAFAPIDVIEEYTRPARFVVNGQPVVRPALSEPELLDFDELGTLEAFNTDGLRSLLVSMAGVPFMRERTLRYPGHIELMRVMRETGLFSQEPILVRGTVVRPLDVTSALLFPKWTYGPGEADLTVLRVDVTGTKGGARFRHRWEMVDRYDPVTDTRSMSRTTGYPAAMMARSILAGYFREPGVHPPEVPGRDAAIMTKMLDGLAARGVRYTHRIDEI